MARPSTTLPPGRPAFLIAAYDHIRLANSDEVEEVEIDGKPLRRGHGERLGSEAVRRLHEATFYGNDVDGRMVRLATMNLTLRGLDKVRILRRDALTRSLDAAAKAELGLPVEGHDVILANPPLLGQDRPRPHRRRCPRRHDLGNRAPLPPVHAQPT